MSRFAIGNTLGGQLYSQYQRDLTNRYLQEKALEEERQRREAERRRQEEQRRKASQHGAFGQTLQTIGQIGGAIAGGLKTGTPQGALAGSQMGSAAASTVMNLFPNIGGTEPSGSNPYYDQPSDMARLGSTINTGLQAYGMYTDSAKPKAREEVINRLTSEMNSGVTWDDNGQTLSYYNASPEQLAARIESFDEYKNATGIFGEDLLKGSSLSIANTINSGIRQSILPQVEFTNSLPDSAQKRQVLTNLQNKYGQNLTNLLPEGSLQAIDAGVQQNIQKATQGATKDANARAVQLFETNYKIAQLGQKKTFDPINVEGADPQLQDSLNRLITATQEATIAGNTKAANDELQKNAASALQDVTTALGKAEKGSQAQQALSALATGLAEQAYGLTPDITSDIYNNLSKDVKATEDPTAKSIQANAERFVNALMNPNPTTGQQLTKEETIAVILDSQTQKDPQGRIIPNSLSPIGEAMLRQVERSKSIEDIINQTNLTTALEEAKRKQQEQLSWWNQTVNAVGAAGNAVKNYIGFGDDSGPQGGGQGNITGPSGNQDMFNFFMSE